MVTALPSLLIAASLIAPGHPVPDGVVYRGVQVVVRPDRIEIRYQLGLNDAMVRTELQNRFGIARASDSDATEDLLEFRNRMAAELPREMKITLDDQPCSLGLHRADVVMQQHAQLEFIYHLPTRATERPQRFLLEDDNYLGVPGFHLMAIKGRGKVDVLQTGSNGESMLARMQGALSEDGSIPADAPPIRQIEAYFALPATYVLPPDQAENHSDVPIQNDPSVATLSDNPAEPRRQNPSVPQTAPPTDAATRSATNADDLISHPGVLVLIPLALLVALALAFAARRRRARV